MAQDVHTTTHIAYRDEDGLEVELHAALELGRQDWELILDCLDALGEQLSKTPFETRLLAQALARDIRSEILNHMPETVD